MALIAKVLAHLESKQWPIEEDVRCVWEMNISRDEEFDRTLLPGPAVRFASDFLDCPPNFHKRYSFIDRNNLSIGWQNLEVRMAIELPAKARFVFSGPLIYPCALNALRVCAASGVCADGDP
jgi:hypothetical protein